MHSPLESFRPVLILAGSAASSPYAKEPMTEKDGGKKEKRLLQF
jgi:hypothetical protein